MPSPAKVPRRIEAGVTLAFLIFPDGTRYEVAIKQSKARLASGRKQFVGFLEGDDSMLWRAVQLNEVRLETDRGQAYSIHVMPDGVNFSFESN